MIIAILQARASSRRLPGKVLKPILGQPMLARQIERIRRAVRLDALVLATSDGTEDDAVAAVGSSIGVPVYRGSLDDVLDRFYRAAEPYRPSHVVRLTGDCPLADWRVIDAVIDLALTSGHDYASNTMPPTFPDGLDVEIIRFPALAAAWREATSAPEREHVTPFLRNHPERFTFANLPSPEDLSALRWTVDEPADFTFVTAIYEALYPADPAFGTDDVLRFARANPQIVCVNSGIKRNAGSELA
jgi:spore coat polysaccharide biosynthesis protein SpsF